MAQQYSRNMMRVSLAQICASLGWNSIHSTPLELLTDVLERYMLQLGNLTHRYAEQFGRTDPCLDDLGLAFDEIGVSVPELTDYLRHVDPNPFPNSDLPQFPVKRASLLEFPAQGSRELAERGDKVDPHLPPMNPSWNEEMLTPKPASVPPTASSLLSPTDPTPPGVSPSSSGPDKRPFTSPTDICPPAKKQRLLPDEAGRSQYEMRSVSMSQSGFLTPTKLGRLPEARTPPPPTPSADTRPATPVTGPSAFPSSPAAAAAAAAAAKPTATLASDNEESNTAARDDEPTDIYDVMARDEFSEDPGVPEFLSPARKGDKKGGTHKTPKISKSSKGAKVKVLKTAKSPSKTKSPSKSKSQKMKSPVVSKSPKVKPSSFSPKSKPKASKWKDLLDSGQLDLKPDTKKSKSKVKLKPAVEKEDLFSFGSPGAGGGVTGNDSMEASSEGDHRVRHDTYDDAIDSVICETQEMSRKEEQEQKRREERAEELSRQREKERELLREKERAYEEEQERLRVLEMERQHEEERERQRELELQRQVAMEQEREMLREKERMIAMEIERERERERQLAMEREREELEHERERDRQRELERERRKQEEEALKRQAEEIEREKREMERKKEELIRRIQEERNALEKQHRPIDPYSYEPDEASLQSPGMNWEETKRSSEKKKKDKLKKEKKNKPKSLTIKLNTQDTSAAMHVSESPSGREKSKVKASDMSSPEWPKVSLEKLTPEDIQKFEYPAPDLRLSPIEEMAEKPAIKPIRIGLGSAGRDFTIKPPRTDSKESKKERKKKKNKDKDREKDRKDRKKEKKREKKEKERSKKTKEPKEEPVLAVPKLTLKIGPRMTLSPSKSDRDETLKSTKTSFGETSLASPEPPISTASSSPERVNLPYAALNMTPSPPHSMSSPPSPDFSPPNSPPSYRSPSPPPSHHPSFSPPSHYQQPSSDSMMYTHSPSPSFHHSPSLSPHPGISSPAGLPSSSPPPAITPAAKAGKGPPVGQHRGVIIETVGKIVDEHGETTWICPSCKMPDDGSPMIGCDACDDWYHWPCVGINCEPPENENWYCPRCRVSLASSGGKSGRGRGGGRGRGRKRGSGAGGGVGRGAKRGRKKVL